MIFFLNIMHKQLMLKIYNFDSQISSSVVYPKSKIIMKFIDWFRKYCNVNRPESTLGGPVKDCSHLMYSKYWAVLTLPILYYTVFYDLSGYSTS